MTPSALTSQASPRGDTCGRDPRQLSVLHKGRGRESPPDESYGTHFLSSRSRPVPLQYQVRLQRQPAYVFSNQCLGTLCVTGHKQIEQLYVLLGVAHELIGPRPLAEESKSLSIA